MEIRIYKLKYPSREEGISDLTSKRVLDENLNFTFPTHAIVDLGDGIFDIMTENEYDFGENEIFPITPNHNFGGWDNII